MAGKDRIKHDPDSATHMTSSELDAAIRELNEQVQVLIAERQLRQQINNGTDLNDNVLKTLTRYD